MRRAAAPSNWTAALNLNRTGVYKSSRKHATLTLGVRGAVLQKRSRLVACFCAFGRLKLESEHTCAISIRDHNVISHDPTATNHTSDLAIRSM